MKYTLITGGAKNLGSALAKHLAKNGHSVIIQYRDSYNEAAEVIRYCQSFGNEAHAVQGNFDNMEGIVAFIHEIKTRFFDVKHLIHNAGNYCLGSTLNTSLSDWEHVFMTNLHLPFLLSQALAPNIIAAQGTITMIGVAGLDGERGDVYSSVYTVAKQALLQLMRSLAKELASHKVKVNMISPGYLENSIDLPDLKKIPFGYPSSFDEIASVINFILLSNTITGQNIEVAGGVRL